MHYIALVLTFLLSNKIFSAQVFHYAPKVEELDGFVKTQTFPGPPEIERGWYLRLSKPITVLRTSLLLLPLDIT